jgi:hypothetical protein
MRERERERERGERKRDGIQVEPLVVNRDHIK